MQSDAVLKACERCNGSFENEGFACSLRTVRQTLTAAAHMIAWQNAARAPTKSCMINEVRAARTRMAAENTARASKINANN